MKHLRLNATFARIAALVVIVLSLAVNAQETMNNEAVIKLVKSGLGEELILNVIRQQPGSYSMGADQLVALKQAGVSERIINAMLSRDKGGDSATPISGARPASATTGTPSESRATITAPGIYYKKNNEYFELIAETVDWKTSGAMKNIASIGFIKKDLRGAIAGPSSRNFLQHPIEVIFSPAPGQSINNFILLPMRPKDGEREFTVGPVNSKSGVAKGSIAYGVEKVGSNLFRLVLSTPLAPGEYGILTTTAVGDTSGKSKMCTFRLLL